MHNQFSEWYLSAGIQPDNTQLVARWAGVQATGADRANVVSLVELFYGFYGELQEYIAKFRGPFHTADGAFRMRENNQELSVLAGAVLVTVIEGESVELADLVAMAIVACACQNLRATPAVKEIPEIAAAYLKSRSENRSADDAAVEDEDEDATNSLELVRVKQGLAVVTEECNMLWWLLSETSRDTGKRWSSLASSNAAILAGKELADLTRITPGPAAVSAFLDKTIRGSKTKSHPDISLPDAIFALPLEWKQTFVREHAKSELQNISPVTLGIKKSIEVTDKEAFKKAFAKASKLSLAKKISANNLAYQIYLESLLSHFSGKVK